VEVWGRSEELYSPLIPCQLLEKIELGFEESLTEVHLGYRELPFACVPILDQQINPVLPRIVQALLVLAFWVDQGPLLGGRAISSFLPCYRVS